MSRQARIWCPGQDDFVGRFYTEGRDGGMERYRTIVKLEEIRRLYDNEEYVAAGKMAEEIRPENIKDMTDLFLLASVYRKKGDYARAKRFLHRIYEKKSSWRVLEELMEVCLAEKNPEEAKKYLGSYAKLSNGDPRNYIYEYRIGRQMHRPDEELLPILQTLKAEEYSEKYAYELAKLYHRLGRRKECEQECADIILWFGEGTYVERARILQAYYRGEMSAADIHTEAQKRIQEAKARELSKRRSSEAKQKEQAQSVGSGLQKQGTAIAGDDTSSVLAAAADPAEPKYAWMEGTGASAADAGIDPEYYAWTGSTEVPAAGAGIEPEYAWTEGTGVPADDAGIEPEYAWTGSTEVPAASAEIKPEYAWMGGTRTSAAGAAGQPAEPVRRMGPGEALAGWLAQRGVTLEGSLYAFAKIGGVRRQLLELLEDVCAAHAGCYYIVIAGAQGSGRTTLGRYITRLFFELGLTKNRKLAKISAEKLNKIKLEEKQEQLRGGALLVENAGSMKEETIKSLLGLGEKKKILSLILLEDTPGELDRLLQRNKACSKAVMAQVRLPEYSEQELVIFAEEQFKNHEYELDADAKTALHKIARQLAVSRRSLEKIISRTEKAIEAADRRTESALLSMALQGKIQNIGAICIIAEDFET